MLTVVHIINRLPYTILENKTPFEKLYGKTPSYEHLKVFGYLCFTSTLAHNRSNFDPRFVPCVFLGYPFGVKGYKLLDLATKKIFISRDVLFHETVFPFISSSYSSSSHSTITLHHLFPFVATLADSLLPFSSSIPEPHLAPASSTQLLDHTHSSTDSSLLVSESILYLVQLIPHQMSLFLHLLIHLFLQLFNSSSHYLCRFWRYHYCESCPICSIFKKI